MNQKVVVVGAGLGGMTAAYRLRQAGMEVEILEANDFAGGRVRTVYRDGFAMDVGADALAVQFYPEYLALLDELGLGDAVAQSTSTLSLLRDGKIIDLDLSKPLRLPFTRLLSWPAKIRLFWGAVLVVRRKLIKGLSISQLFRNAAEDDPGVSARDLSQQLFGNEVTDYLIDPISKIHNSMGPGHTSTIDMRYAITPMTLGAVVGGTSTRYGHLWLNNCPFSMAVSVEKCHQNR